MINKICCYLILFAIIILSLQQEIRSLKQYKLH
jgi:hypothetical protein